MVWTVLIVGLGWVCDGVDDEGDDVQEGEYEFISVLDLFDGMVSWGFFVWSTVDSVGYYVGCCGDVYGQGWVWDIPV